MNELKKWVPLWYCRESAHGSAFIRGYIEGIVRRFLNAVLSFPILILILAVFSFIIAQTSELFWETISGRVVVHIMGGFAIFASLRSARRPSYSIYHRIFREGLYFM